MSGSIGKLALQITADQTELQAELNKTEGYVRASTDRMNQRMTTALAGAGGSSGGSALGAVMAGLDKVDAAWSMLDRTQREFFTEGTKGWKLITSAMRSTLGQIPLVGGFFTLVAGVMDSFASKDSIFANIARVGKLSDRLGVSTEFLSSLQAAGAELETVEKASRALDRSLAGLKLEGEDVGGSLKKFSSATVDLSPEKLIGAGFEGRVRAIDARWREMGSSIDRSALLQAAFGRSAAEMEKVMVKGLDAQIAKAKELGRSFSRGDAAGVEVGLASIKRINETLEGAKVQLAIGIAPYISAIALAFERWVKSGGSLTDTFRKIGDFIGDAIITGLETTAQVIDEIVGLIEKAKSIMSLGQSDKTEKNRREWARILAKQGSDATTMANLNRAAAGGDEKAVQNLRDIKRAQEEVAAGFPSAGDKVRKLAGTFRDAYAEVKKKIDQAAASAGTAHEEFSGLIDMVALDAANKKFSELTAKYESLLAAGGKTGRDQEIAAMAIETKRFAEAAAEAEKEVKKWADAGRQADGIGQVGKRLAELQTVIDKGVEMKDRLDALKFLDQQLKGIAMMNKALEDAARVHKDIATPMEALNEKLAELDKLLLVGALSWDDYSRAVGKAGSEAEKAMDKQKEFSSPKAIVKGSKEEYSLMLNQQNRGDVDRTIAGKLTEHKKVLEDIRDGIGALIRAGRKVVGDLIAP